MGEGILLTDSKVRIQTAIHLYQVPMAQHAELALSTLKVGIQSVVRLLEQI